MATDSQVSAGFTKKILEYSHSFKILKKEHGVHLCLAGALRDLNILSVTDLKKIVSDSIILDDNFCFETVVSSVVPALMRLFGNNGRLVLDKMGIAFQSEFLIAYKDQCFIIDQDGSVVELTDMFAIGSGSDVAESAHTILRSVGLTPQQQAINAAISACERDLFVGFPILLTHTMTDEYQMFDGENLYTLTEEGPVLLGDAENSLMQNTAIKKTSNEPTEEICCEEEPSLTDSKKTVIIKETCENCTCKDK